MTADLTVPGEPAAELPLFDADGLMVVGDDMHVSWVSPWVASICAPLDPLTGTGLAARLRTLATSLVITQVAAKHPDRVVVHEVETPTGTHLFQFQVIEAPTATTGAGTTDARATGAGTTVAVSDITDLSRRSRTRTPQRWTVVCDLDGKIVGSRGASPDDGLPAGSHILEWLNQDPSADFAEHATRWWADAVAGGLAEPVLVTIRNDNQTPHTVSVRATRVEDRVIVDALLTSASPERYARSGDEVMVVAETGEVTWASPGFVTILDRAMHDLVGMMWTELVVAEDHHRILATESLVTAGAQQRSRVPLLFRVTRPDGDIRTLEGARVDMRDDPAVSGMLVACRDVTDRVSADRRIQQTERRMEAIMNASVGAVVIFEGADVTWANDAFERLVGAAAEMYMRPGFIASLVADATELADVRAAAALAAADPGVEYPFELDIIRSNDGERRRVAGQITNWLNDDGIGAVVANCRDVTDLALIAAELAAAEAKFRTIVDASVDPIFVIAPDRSRVLMANSACKKMFPGWEHFDARLPDVHYDDLGRVTALFDEAAASRCSPIHDTFRVRTRGGGVRHVRGIIADFSDDANIGGFVVVLSDITATVEADTLVASEEERWRLLLAHATEGLIVFDIVDESIVVSYASETVSAFLGIDVQEFIADPQAVFHPDDFDAIYQALLRIDSATSPVEMTTRVRHPEDGWRWVEASIRDLRHVPQIAGLVVNVRNISDVVLARNAARRAAARYESVVAHLAEGLLLADATGVITEANAAVLAILEVPAEEIIGTNAWAANWNVSDPVTGIAVLGNDIPGLHTLFSGVRVAGSELVYTTPSGTRKVIRVHASPFVDGSNKAGAAAGIADVTAEFDARTQRQELISTVSALNAELQTVIAVSAAERDRERQRIALELHDDAVQMIVAARWKVDELAEPDVVQDRAAAVTGVSDLLEQTVIALRSIILDLRPPALDDRGLYGAVCDFVGRLGGGVSWSCEDSFDQLGRSSVVNKDVQALVWRTVCEAARNVTRHSGAANATVRFDVVPGLFVVTVEDDGVGVSAEDLHDASSFGHIGMVSMRETVFSAGGSFSASMIDPAALRPGWRIRFSIPLDDPPPAAAAIQL